MCECEARGLPVLFKLRQTEDVVRHLAELSRRREWRFAGGGWRAVSSELQLQGWTKKRLVSVLRRPLQEQSIGYETETPNGQKVLVGKAVLPKSLRLFEYAVLVTSLSEAVVLMVAQQYRNLGDTDNSFDELKNQSAWTGFPTHNLKRRQLMARIVALQLVEFVGAIGGAGPPYRGGDEPAGAGLWSCQTDHAWESVESDDHELRWQGGSDREVTG